MRTMGRRDWVALSIALLSLAISVLTVYFNLLQEKDDLRMVVGRVPTFFANPEDNIVEIADSLELTFLNSGNRPIAITRADLVIFQTNDEDPECVFRPNQLYIDYLMDPFVLKPGEIAVKNLNQIRYTAPWNKNKNPEGRRAATLENLDFKKYIIGCFSPEFITPDTSRIAIEFPLFRTMIATLRGNFWFTMRIQHPAGEKPIVIYERVGTFLGDLWVKKIGNRRRELLDFSPHEY